MTIPHSDARKPVISLSIPKRLQLIDALNGLPLSQFLKIEIALSVPWGVMPGYDAPQGQRTATLLQWLEGSSGKGLGPLLDILSHMGIEILGDTASRTGNDHSNTRTLTVKLEGDFAELDREKLDQLLAEFRSMANDYSVEITTTKPGSIEIELQGDSESLERIKALLDGRKKTHVAGLNVETTSSLKLTKQKGGLNLRGADLTEADLRGAYLTEADLTRADLTGADLIEAYLIEADLTGAHLYEAYLTRAYLIEADLSSASLTGAHLTRAYLTRADLTRAHLTRANLTRADLRGANLTRADLQQTIMTGCRGLSPSDITEYKTRGAIFNDAPGDKSSIYSRPRVPR